MTVPSPVARRPAERKRPQPGAQDRVCLAPSFLRMQGSEAHFTDATIEAQSVQMENSALQFSQCQMLETWWIKEGRLLFSSDFKVFFNK